MIAANQDFAADKEPINPGAGILLFGVVLTISGLLFVGEMIGRRQVQQSAIRHGVAIHNPRTGAFEWCQPGSAKQVDNGWEWVKEVPRD